MKPAKLITALSVAVMASIVFAATDANEILRTREDTYKPLKATKEQAKTLHKIDDKYGALLNKLRKDKPKDYGIQRDNLNQKYTHDFMAAMNPIQKSDYRKYIRGLKQKYMKSHPEVDADNIFIWGGSDIL